MKPKRSWLRQMKTIVSMNKYFDKDLSLRHKNEMFIDLQENENMFDVFVIRNRIDKAIQELDFKMLFELLSYYQLHFFSKNVDQATTPEQKQVYAELDKVFKSVQQELEKLIRQQTPGALETQFNQLHKQWVELNKQKVVDLKKVTSILDNSNATGAERKSSRNLMDQGNSKVKQLRTEFSVKRFLVTSCAVACSITILYWGSLFVYDNVTMTNEKLYDDYFSVPANFMHKNNTGFSNIQELYDAGKYNEAYSLLNQNPTIDKVISQFYKGILAMELRKYEEAIHCLEFVQDQQVFENYTITQWYLGLAYLKTNQSAKAKETFAKIANHDIFRQQDAKRIVKRIVD